MEALKEKFPQLKSGKEIMRLNGWHWLGIVLSVLWVLVGNVWLHHVLLERDEAYRSCLAAMTRRLFQCEAPDHIGRDTLFFTLVAVPLAWFLVYIVVWTVRWIRRRGFQPS
jgi:hypothetical protein